MSVILKHIGNKWQPIPPFNRSDKKTIEEDLKDGEAEYEVCAEFIHIVEWDGKPPLLIELTFDEIAALKQDPNEFRKNREFYRSKCFLWIIDNHSLKIAREKIRNEKRALDPDYICHTNLTNAGQAYIGGEILFGEDGFIYINYYSDRYGGRNTPEELWIASKGIFRDLGYTHLVDFLEL